MKRRLENPVDLLVVNDNNQLLLIKREEEEKGFKGYWSVPGGGADVGESFEEALVREVKEEIGCEILEYSYFKSYFYQNKDGTNVRSTYFYGKIDGEIVLSDEHSEYVWVDLNETILNYDFAFNQRLVVEDFLKFWKEKHKLLDIN